MTDTKELHSLIAAIEAKGGIVVVEYDDEALENEGRKIIESVSIVGVKGIGPCAMSPITAAEAMRRVLAKG